MPDRPLISMVLIGRDEADNVEPCFSSWWTAVDEVVYCDTGSSDGTLERVKAFAAARGETEKLIVTEYEWHHDFAAARNHAQSLATGEWLVWADLDDEILGAGNLRPLARIAPAACVALFADYSYAQDPHGNTICTLKRERLVRAGHGTWKGRVHEAQMFDGPVQMIPPDKVLWRHRKQPGTPTDRNLKILEQWALDEPDNGRVIQYLGTERAGNGQHEQAIEAFEHYLTLDGEMPEPRAQCWRKLAASLIALGRTDEAFQAGISALAENPDWPDAYLTLAQTSHILGRHEHAIHWAQQVLDRGMPDSLLILNPLDYTIEPKVAMAGSLGVLGRLDEACALAEEVLAQVPEHPLLAPAYGEWRVSRKRRTTAGTWLSCAKVLCEHDEQAKALAVLETVPYYAMDDPEIVRARSQLRERLAFAARPALYAEHYTSGGSKPEDMIADDTLTDLCERLPRVQFLRRTLAEMQEAA